MPMTDPREIAADIARELREHPERWTKGRDARDREGRAVCPTDPSAVCWCLIGHCDRRSDAYAYVEFREIAKRFVEGRVLTFWNDHPSRTVDDVIELCDKVAKS